ncbi:MAG: hypothetical protein HOK41_04580 [Nitrospina sp.]|nr:hypothetical protein [Nitrospina sp.]
MAGKKISVEFDVQEDLVKMLEYATDKYRLGDKSKALRCILDYVATDADWEEMFKQIRCIRCGPDGGWSQQAHEAKQGK